MKDKAKALPLKRTKSNKFIIALASATGEKSPLQTVGVCQCLTQTKPRPSLAEEVPKAPTKARFTEEGEALRPRSPRDHAPPGKKVFNES